MGTVSGTVGRRALSGAGAFTDCWDSVIMQGSPHRRRAHAPEGLSYATGSAAVLRVLPSIHDEHEAGIDHEHNSGLMPVVLVRVSASSRAAGW
jgi:hypothetical protein